jgi:hypothetical protein
MMDSRVSTLLAIQKALTKAGIEFLAADQKGEGTAKKPKAVNKRCQPLVD